MERRSCGIPVAKFRTTRSRVRDVDYTDKDPEHDLFTLIEDNIALKEENEAVRLEHEELKKRYSKLEKSNQDLIEKMAHLQIVQQNLEAAIQNRNRKCALPHEDNNTTEELTQLSSLNHSKLLRRHKSHETPGAGSSQLKHNLVKVLPIFVDNRSEIGNIIDIDFELDLTTTTDLCDRLIQEFLSLKNSSNATELQLYEANEKISELLENQHLLEETNRTLRSENSNLTTVAKLLTENVKETVETTIKMRSALIKQKEREAEVIGKPDLIDGQSTNNLEILESKQELENVRDEQNSSEHSERIVEMELTL